MALRVAVVEGGLEFRTDHYFFNIGNWRLRLPRWIGPGQTVVRHIDRGNGDFEFSLSLAHPLFGELVYQLGIFRDG